MMTMPIERAAQRERAAERNRVQAEAAWREAWWQVTLALGAVPDSDKQGITTTLDTAQRILGQSRSWLSSRRKLGRAFASLPPAAVHQLPPRLSIAYCEARADATQAVAVLHDAQARGLSLRDFSAELGTQPKSWLRESEQAQRPVTIDQLRAQPVTEQAAVIRAALENPAVAAQVRIVQYPPVPPARPNGPVPLPPHRPAITPSPDPGLPDVLVLLGEARDSVERAFKLSVLRGLAGDEQTLTALGHLEREAGYLHKYLNGQAADDAITKILADS